MYEELLYKNINLFTHTVHFYDDDILLLSISVDNYFQMMFIGKEERNPYGQKFKIKFFKDVSQVMLCHFLKPFNGFCCTQRQTPYHGLQIHDNLDILSSYWC